MPKIRIGHSPDADDAFMYYAIAHGKVKVGEYEVEHVLEDIESLNLRAVKGELEGTAISAGAYPTVEDKYRIMRVGASIGRNYGPLVVAKSDRGNIPLDGSRIARPGKYTTAYLLLRIYANGFEPVPMDFDVIIPAVQEGKVDAGLLIHEGQVTYQDEGLIKLLDVGEAWGQDTGLPIPLGLDMVRRDLGEEMAQLMAETLKESIQYAFDHEDEALDYAIQFSRGTEREICRQFVRMYVNEDTLDMGEEGRLALETLYTRAKAMGVINEIPKLDLV